MKIKCKNLSDTKKLAWAFAKNLPERGAFVSLYGDIGAGKTAFVRCILSELGVKQKVTSPSFVILNEYHGYKMPIYHFDLYRLENEGVRTIEQELYEYSKNGILTFVEWADFGKNNLSYDRLNIKISYPEVLEYSELGDPREFEFIPNGAENEIFAQKIINDYEAN